MKHVLALCLGTSLLLGFLTLTDCASAKEKAGKATHAESVATSENTTESQNATTAQDAAETQNTTEGSTTPDAPRERLEGAELLKAARQALKTWVKVPDEQVEDVAREFALLFDDLKADTKIPPMAKARVTEDVRKKLDTLAKRIARLARKQAKANRLAKTGEAPKSVRLPNDRNEVVGQFMGGGGAEAENFNRSAELAEANGEQLADLIQNLIQPDSWEANGGNGTIRYWNTRGSLIIYQTVPVHEEIEGTLEQIRRASY